MFGILNFGHCYLPFDLAQGGGELVEPFGICNFRFIPIQLVPRLPEPTLVTAVPVEPDVPVKRGQPLFQFDRRPYEYKVRQIEAQLAQANQNVQVMKADTEAAAQKVAKLKSELVYAKYQQKLSAGLAGRAPAAKKTPRGGLQMRRPPNWLCYRASRSRWMEGT